MAYRATEKTEAQRLERIERIVREARALIGQSGFSGTRMLDIARRSDMSEGAIYRYFPTAVSLYVEVFRMVAGEELDVVRAVAEEDHPPIERLARALRLHGERALRRPRLAYAMLAEPLAPELESTRLQYRRAFHEVFAALMAEAIRLGQYQDFDTTLAAACMTGAMDEALISPSARVARHASDRAARVDFVVQFCMNSIAPWQVRTTRRRP